MTERKLHAIMVALPYQGHITPFINLALKLASNGCTVTFVHTQHVHHMLSNAHQICNSSEDSFSKARESGLDIRYKTISDGFPVEYDRMLNFNDYWESILSDFPSRVDELICEINQENDDTSLIPFLVADTFYSWPATIAKKYNMVNVSLWTEPALVFSILYHLDLLRENGHFPFKGNHEDEIDYVPGVEPISSKDLMSFLKSQDITTMEHQIIYKGFEQVKFADFILINTVSELEHNTIWALNHIQPTFAIGPISFLTDFTKPIVPKSLWIEHDCTQWLNSKPVGSVLYVSFGSVANINKELTEEIAHGLMLSEVNFIWVLRDNGTQFLPDGFKDQIGDRGLVVSWCNQNEVISNLSVGGFLTHCGWNSILESIWWAVPLICHPFHADQPTNRKLVVDDWKIGINLSDRVAITREEVAEKIKRTIMGVDAFSMRGEIKKLSNILHCAVGNGGSSITNFDKFVVDLRANMPCQVSSVESAPISPIVIFPEISIPKIKRK